MSEDFNIKMTVRNARLLNAIRETYESVAAFCRENKLSYHLVSQLITMKSAPTTSKGWRKVSMDICDVLQVDPQKIWPNHIEEMRLKKSTAEVEVNIEQLDAIMGNKSDPLHLINQTQVISQLSDALSPREKQFIIYRYVEKMTLQEIADKFGISSSRALEIEKKALRRMKNKAKYLGCLTSTFHKFDCGTIVKSGEGLTEKGRELFTEETWQ